MTPLRNKRISAVLKIKSKREFLIFHESKQLIQNPLKKWQNRAKKYGWSIEKNNIQIDTRIKPMWRIMAWRYWPTPIPSPWTFTRSPPTRWGGASVPGPPDVTDRTSGNPRFLAVHFIIHTYACYKPNPIIYRSSYVLKLLRSLEMRPASSGVYARFYVCLV